MEHDFKLFPELTNSQMSRFYFDSPHEQITENFDAKVENVHDGDTITVSVPFRDFKFPIRFENCMAAELNEKGGIASRNWLKGQIQNKNIEVIVNPKNRVGKYGRLLGRVISDGIDIGELSKQFSFSIGVEEERGDVIDLLLTLGDDF